MTSSSLRFLAGECELLHTQSRSSHSRTDALCTRLRQIDDIACQKCSTGRTFRIRKNASFAFSHYLSRLAYYTFPPQRSQSSHYLKSETCNDPLCACVDRIRIFSIPLAKTFLLLSALVYERKNHLVLAAGRDVKASKSVDKSPNASKQLLESAQAKVAKSEEVIRVQVSFNVAYSSRFWLT